MKMVDNESFNAVEFQSSMTNEIDLLFLVVQLNLNLVL